MLILVLLPGWFLVENAENQAYQRLRNRIEGFAPIYANELSAMGHEKITPDTPPDDPLYLAMIEKQIRWLELNPLVADIYTYRKHPQGNELIVDSETDYDHNGSYEGDRESRTEIGEVWVEFSDAIDRVFAGKPGFEDRPYTDRWGTWVSAYVPMLNKNGEIDAVLGVDYPATDWLTTIKRSRLVAIGSLGFIFTLALSAGTVISMLRINLIERQRSELAQRDAKRALAKSNQELEQFAYVASHDLREPLRMVTSFLQLLEKKYQGELDDKARLYISHAVDGSNRMRDLINGLLELSRVDRDGRPIEAVNTNAALTVALDNLAIVIKESGTTVTRKDLPIVEGDRVQIIQLFQNLVSNAIKFCNTGAPEIEILARPIQLGDTDSWVFSVQDNGPGIAPEYHERIYRIFQRLEPDSDVPGTGIGLALCRRIVERHGGEITVDSDVGKGSIFRFTLPAIDEDDGDSSN